MEFSCSSLAFFCRQCGRQPFQNLAHARHAIASAMDTARTTAPLFGCAMTSPSCSRRTRASAIVCRLTPISCASAYSRSRWLGATHLAANDPSARSRRAPGARSCTVPHDGWQRRQRFGSAEIARSRAPLISHPFPADAPACAPGVQRSGSATRHRRFRAYTRRGRWPRVPCRQQSDDDRRTHIGDLRTPPSSRRCRPTTRAALAGRQNVISLGV